MQSLFRSERLLFRQFTTDDAALFYDLNSDPEVIKYVHEAPTTKENAEEIIRTIVLPQYDRKLGRWAVHIISTGEFIGWAGLKYLADIDEIDLGYRFKKQYWGKGYATESAKACIQFAFNEIKLQRIIARAHRENAGSLNVIEKCGMRFVKDEIVAGSPVKVYELVNHSQ